MVNVAIDGGIQEAQPDELLIDVIQRTGGRSRMSATTRNSARFRPVTHAWSKWTAAWSGLAQPWWPME
jgi:hypothetical protein